MMIERELPHRRRNLLTGEWVLVSPHRGKRPWQGLVEQARPAPSAQHDPGCHLCPGNRRITGEANPDYSDVFVFSNDFAALLDAEELPPERTGPFEEQSAKGLARVLCYAPDHSLTLATMTPRQRREVIECWCNQSAELGQRWAHVQIFENKGAMMGASSPHPHGQVWASDFVPQLVDSEDRAQQAWFAARGAPLLDAVVAAELADGRRVVAVNADWMAVVPHWAAWPFETLVLARRPVTRLEYLDDAARVSLAEILAILLKAYDRLFDTPFPYSMGWHGAPHGLGADDRHWRLHAHFYPPLLRSASIRKHMVGFELLAEIQRDLTPEAAAAALREGAAA